MEGVTKTMSKIMKSMDLEKTDKTMQAFEKTFEELDVLTSVSTAITDAQRALTARFDHAAGEMENFPLFASAAASV